VLKIPAATIQHCGCKPGFYSPFTDRAMAVRGRELEFPASTVGFAGMPCEACHVPELVSEMDIAMYTCGSEQSGFTMRSVYPDSLAATDLGKYCVDPANPVCVGFNQVCKAYCPGGVIPPISKRYFYSEGWLQKSIALFHETAKYAEGKLKGEFAEIVRWNIELCKPIDACRGYDRCDRPFFGEFCASCRFKFYREKGTGRCVACGYEQVIGMLVMTVVIVCGTVGTLVFAIIIMKFKSDLKFQTVIKTVVRVRVQKPIIIYWQST
jgi:hypothetical protein